MRSLASLVIFALGCTAVAQIPDVQVKADIGLTYRSEIDGVTVLRFYDPFGHVSTFAFQFALEPGFRAYVAQRLQRLPGDADPSQIDESYVEDVGVWRAGKQYLPFGTQTILRESVLAVRSDTEALFGVFPVTVAACDGGEGRPRGLVGRVGREFGASIAVGTNFGISGTSLTGIRDPEDSPGKGHGYRRVVGFDYVRSIGVGRAGAEYVMFQDGHQDADNFEVLELFFTLEPDPNRSVKFSYVRGSGPRVEQVSVVGSFRVQQNLWVEPFVRIRDSQFRDVGATLRVRI